MQKISRFVALVLGLVSPVLAATASAQPLPCQVTIAAPANNSTVSGTVAVSIDNSCTGNLSVFDRVYVFNTGTFQFSSSPYFWDTTSIPNGTYTIVAIAWDPTGLIEEGISADVSLTIANGVAATQPTPTPAKPTPTPAPTSSPGGLLPYGNIAPPAGTSWYLIYDDEFTNDTAVNSSLWNGADAGGVPMCYPSGANSSLCQSVYVSETIWDCLGYSGEQSCANSYGGTLPDGASYGESIQTGVGLLVQPAPAPYTDPDPTYGAGQYEDNAWAGLNNYGKLSTVIYGYFEWKAKLPTDVSGEGDGIHTDLWCTTNDRNSEGNASQVDVNEWIGGTSNHTTTSWNICQGPPNDSCINAQIYSAPGNPDLTQTYHVYGLLWTGSASSTYGYMTIYVDGVAAGSPVAVNVPDWGTGIYCYAGWAQGDIKSSNISGLGNNALGRNTSDNDPLIVQYHREWQYHSPAPPSAPSGSFEALIGGGTLYSSYVIDAGFFTAAYGFPPAAETYLYYQTNPYQQFIFAPSGTNYTICNVESGACLTDGGNVVDIGQGTDTWAVTQSGSGWTLQDTRTGQYMGAIPLTSESNIPMSSTPVTVSLSIIQ